MSWLSSSTMSEPPRSWCTGTLSPTVRRIKRRLVAVREQRAMEVRS